MSGAAGGNWFTVPLGNTCCRLHYCKIGEFQVNKKYKQLAKKFQYKIVELSNDCGNNLKHKYMKKRY